MLGSRTTLLFRRRTKMANKINVGPVANQSPKSLTAPIASPEFGKGMDSNTPVGIRPDASGNLKYLPLGKKG